MPETLQKLSPHRDLQCYFERPSAVAALSAASDSGFTVSGSWRQQFDWAVVEWNRDNVFEHPALRYLPDGDLSGLRLSYEETRLNCMPLDSDVYPTVDWPYLRIWADNGEAERVYKVPLRNYAVPVEGNYQPAWAEFELQGTPTAGDYIGLSWLTEHHTYQLYGVDTAETAVQALVDSVNAFSPTMKASREGTRIRLTYVGAGQTLEQSATGANGNRIGAYGFVAGAKTEVWAPVWQHFQGGTSPTKWRIELDFSSLRDVEGAPVPTNAVRKMRWTYAADLQRGAFERSDFEVKITNWSVSGTGRQYRVAGSGSYRIEDDCDEVLYTGCWARARGNFSGGSISVCEDAGGAVACSYQASCNHALYLGTRMAPSGPVVQVEVDGLPVLSKPLALAGEDVLVRLPLGEFGPGEHSVNISHGGPGGGRLYFDYLEVAVPTAELPVANVEPRVTLATDWDTDHSLALAPERTAWMIQALGFKGRVNHYAGALWFYELARRGHQYASATIDFAGTPVFSETTRLRIGRVGAPPGSEVEIQHVSLIGDSAATVAKAFELIINSGYTAVRAIAEGNRLTLYSRAMGQEGNAVTISATSTAESFQAVCSGATLTGGVDGSWYTDLGATPRLNRAARDWTRSLAASLSSTGVEMTAAFSMELQHGDPSLEAGIAQRYPSGNPVTLNTPALQTNFSPESLAFWTPVYREMAGILEAGGQVPYLQFGEVQWWYFPSDGSGMPFYDAYTKERFRALYGRDLSIIASNHVDPGDYPEEVEFLPGLIGEFTAAIMAAVRTTHPNCRFEVLYPCDVNDTPFNRAVNLPVSHWGPGQLDNFKTESFTYTLARDLDKGKGSIKYGGSLGFPPAKRSHLVGISDYTTPWFKEVDLARSENLECTVLFALDQFSLIGYPLPLQRGQRRSLQLD